MTTQYVTLTSEIIAQAAQHISTAITRMPGIQAAALCALNGQCLWASDAAFERAAPSIAKIGIMSLKLWVKVRTGKLDRIGLITAEGAVDIMFVPPIASVLVISCSTPDATWIEDEPAALLRAIGYAR